MQFPTSLPSQLQSTVGKLVKIYNALLQNSTFLQKDFHASLEKNTCRASNKKDIHDEYINGLGGSGSSSSTAMSAAEDDPCCPAFDAVVVVDGRALVRINSSGSFGRKSFRSTNPELAEVTGMYLLSSRNLMNFSWAGTTLAGLLRISNVGSVRPIRKVE
ncbi:photosystem II reaction center Psb28 protein [Striga asiatica]|uniref:Photosystem II reaction center Psb28 protein n=1 Tax=Striga asiatica TaxID=4170 RepID=A0A5A7QYG3_STRAF|nr:photosystem II reaction center Psb28 protein [Striga asiatica]